MDKFHQCLTELHARNMIMAGYYSLTFLLANFLFSIDIFDNKCQENTLFDSNAFFYLA